MRASLKLLSEVRDLQVVDKDGRNCGICDDILFQGHPGESLEIRALLIGPGALQRRLPYWAAWLVRNVSGERVVAIPWEDIETITSRIQLSKSAGTYGLHRADNRIAPYLKRIPAL